MAGWRWSARRRTIADQMEEWLYSDACDGFNIMFPYVPGGLDDFVDRVVPELQRRGLFRTRIRGADLARESRPAAPGEPLLRIAARRTLSSFRAGSQSRTRNP